MKEEENQEFIILIMKELLFFYQKEFNKKIVEKIDISLPYEDNLNISDIGKILNIEIWNKFYNEQIIKKEYENKKVLVGYNGIDGKK